MDDVEIRKKMFGKEVAFFIRDADRILAEEVVEQAYEEGLRLQRIFNLYDKKSELNRLNKKRALRVSDELLFVLENALKMAKETGGLYDISLGKQFLERKSGKEVSKLDCSYEDIVISGNEVRLLHEAVLIDLGSIAKGYIGDKLAEIIVSKGILSGLIDARGDIVSFGDESEIEIQHPREREKSIGKIKVRNAGIATSGDYSQYNKSFDESHIINKRDFISVSVIAPTLMEADMYATAVFVTPKEKVKSLLDKNKNVKVFCIDRDLNPVCYNKFEVIK